jgi:hypothetical protein
MRPTDGIAMSAVTNSVQFPENVEWSFSPEDRRFLCHWPDPVVRPGGLPFSNGSSAPGLPGRVGRRV